MSQPDSHEPWIDAGISGRGRIDGLLYNRPSDTLVLLVYTHLQRGLSVKRLYFRPVAETSYHPITVQDNLESQENAVCCDAAPFLIYNELRVRPPEPSSSVFAADWECVRRFNLVTRLSEIVLDGQSLQPSPPYVSGWVSSIIAAWPDGSGAICSLGFKRPEGDGKLVADYSVYEVSFKDGIRRQIATLPGVFL